MAKMTSDLRLPFPKGRVGRAAVLVAEWFARRKVRRAVNLLDVPLRPHIIRALCVGRYYHSLPDYVAEWIEAQNRTGDAVDDLYDVMNSLREGGHYEQADRIRTIMARLSRLYPQRGSPDIIRNVVRSFK